MQTNVTVTAITSALQALSRGLAVLLLAGGVIAGVAATGSVAASTCDEIRADINGDCAVSGQDLFVLLSHLGETGASATSGASPLPWDLNGDGAISGLDLFALLRGFGQVGA